MQTPITFRRTVLAASMLAALGLARSAAAQSSSLYGSPDHRAPLTLANDSWLYQKVEPPKELQLNDIITVVVDEKSQMISEGQVDQRQQASLKARVLNWIKLDGFGIKPAPQVDGDPQLTTSLTSQNRAESEIESRDALRFRIAARVVDVWPNGNLVLEARRSVKVNDEEWEQSLIGVIRREDVLPNNTVLSEDIDNLRLYKRENGQVRDGYRRGWLLKAIDRVKPF